MQLPVTTEDWIRFCVDDFNADAERGERFIHAGGRGITVKTDGEKVVTLPNMARVRIHTDASGRATHVEEDEHLHAVARPATYRLNLREALRGR